MPRLRRLSGLCSRTVSGTAYSFRHGSTLCSPTEEKILCRSPFSQRSHVGNLRQTLQGKGVIHKRVETAGVYPLVRPRGVSASCLPACAPAGQARFPRFASDTLPFCTRTQKRNTAASQCPSLRILLVFVFLIFLLCGIGRTAALFCAHRRRCLLRFNERVCLRVDTLMPAIVVRIHGQTALF